MARAPSTRTPPPARARTRRVIQVDDSAPTVAPEPRPVTDEGRFDYGDSFASSPAMRYRQMKAIEGRDVARAWAKQHMLRLAFSGVAVQEIAQTFGFSVRYTETILGEAKAEVRRFTAESFDGLTVVAEHMLLYRQLRENAYFAMNKTQVSEIDRYRARESLMAVMRQEFDFTDKMGGFKGITLSSSSEDEATRAAREMGQRIASLTEALEDVFEGDMEDEAPPAVEQAS